MATADHVYGAVKVIRDETVVSPLFPVKTIFYVDPPVLHGVNFENEDYPIIDASYYGDYVKEIFAAIEKHDPDLIERSLSEA